MKKQIQSGIRAHLKQTAFYLILVLALRAIPFALAQRSGTSQSVTKPTNVITVTNTNDSGPGSLRNALAIANDGDTIDATGVSGTILLTNGELQINHNVTINGPGASNLAVNGNATSRVFENFASNVTISGFTTTNGHPADNNGGGGILNHGGLTLTGTSILSNNAGGSTAFNLSSGGGINSDSGGTLMVTDSVINNNQAGGVGVGAGSGGGISAESGIVTVSNSTINGNQASGCGLFCSSGAGGIAMRGGGTLSVTNSTISGNSADSGGGININGTLTVTNSVITGNSGNFSGGGIVASGGTVMVSSSTISGNSFFCDGGGIESSGQLTVVNSTISSNGALGGNGAFGCGPEPHGGGGINNGGITTVINSTISGNHADLSSTGAGGGIFNRGSLTVTNSTISDNTASVGGGAVYNDSGGQKAQIGDTVLSAGASGGTIFNNGGTVTSLGYNLASDDGGGVLTGPGDHINTDPMLGPLQDNGGPTFTHALLPGSPAINAGDPSFTPRLSLTSAAHPSNA